MKKFAMAYILMFFPVLALAADSALSFAPPPTDYSMVFLGNLFGVVDGVLHGGGSQIMGTMFGVFNSAVLALGGIIIMYTLMVSTMNTAHEGQMLGQKWSSIWIPVRSTVGLALLIPKASGYCLMQIFVMWVVVQGVGAADKIWNAALDYLNRGGSIIQGEVKSPLGSGDQSMAVANGAATMLSGQVCMLGLQKSLENKRQDYLKIKQDNSGPCSGTPVGAMKTFCSTAIPDFINSVNLITVQQAATGSPSTYTSSMPNFDADSPYSFLNGICGSITWNGMSAKQLKDATSVAGSNVEETVKVSRAIGAQQMYMDLSTVARVIVNNNPQLSKNLDPMGSNKNYSTIARDQFGVPYTANGQVCRGHADDCMTWGNTPGATSARLFSGTEFMGAIKDYNSILKPTMQLLKSAKSKEKDKSSRDFITDAQNKGWILAGSYFFDLVRLNGSAKGTTSLFDKDSGLDKSSFDLSTLATAYKQGSCSGTYSQLCIWLNADTSTLSILESMINGEGLGDNPLSLPQLQGGVMAMLNNITAIDTPQASTAYGFIINSLTMTTPGQPGINPAFKFAKLNFNFSLDKSKFTLPKQRFPCGDVAGYCLGRMLGDLFYNLILRSIFSVLINIAAPIVSQLALAMMIAPLAGMAVIFQEGLRTISAPGVNPIVALANMGTTYINFSNDIWAFLLGTAVMYTIFWPIGIPLLIMLVMAAPLIMSWIGVMVGIGFSVAYYVPLLPYLIFTFGTIAWFMAVIEAMVAGPLVALGVTHPEGHDAFGKGEQAVMILMNVFLRPSMMIIGYIAAIALSYVGVWVLNAGYEHAISFMQPPGEGGVSFGGNEDANKATTIVGYTSYAGLYAFFFSILAYTTTYIIIVQKSFTLITKLPDQILRWIGGNAEQFGSESSQWGEEGKGKMEKAGDETQRAQGQLSKQAAGYGEKAAASIATDGASEVAGGAGKVAAKGGGGADSAGGGDAGGGDAGGGPEATPAKGD